MGGKKKVEKEQLQSKDVSLSRLLGVVKDPRVYKPFGASFVAMGLSTTVTMQIPKYIGQVLDMAVNPAMFDQILPLVQQTAVIITAGAIANAVRIFYQTKSAESINLSLRDGTYRRLIYSHPEYYDRQKLASSEIVSRLASDTRIIGQGVTDNFSSFWRALIQLTLGFYSAFLISPDLLIRAAPAIPLIVGVSTFCGRQVAVYSKQMQSRLSDSSRVANETLGVGLKTVHAFNRQAHETKRYHDSIFGVRNAAISEAQWRAAMFGFNTLSGNLAVFYMLYSACELVQRGDLTVGGLTSFALYSTWMGVATGNMFKVFSAVKQMQGAGSRVFEFLETPLPNQSAPSNSLQSALLPIHLNSLNFHYPSRPDIPIFTNLDLEFRGDSRISAIVGSSGSGKSTIAQLILGLYKPESGDISFSDKAFSEIDLAQIRAEVGYVAQEPVLFSRSIKENVLYGVPQGKMVKENEIVQALKDANAWSFVEKLPAGMDTLVGEMGGQLSGGQRQRIAIARALIRRPQLLIFDEATSALDAKSEQRIQSAIEAAAEKCAVIMIAHRLSTVKRADRIFVLDEGQLIEEGSFDELLQKPDGVFRKLVETQALVGSTTQNS